MCTCVFTALTLQFVTHTFQEDHDPTIGEYCPGTNACMFVQALFSKHFQVCSGLMLACVSEGRGRMSQE